MHLQLSLLHQLFHLVKGGGAVNNNRNQEKSMEERKNSCWASVGAPRGR